jgi:sulfur transfer protein SufE
MTLRQRQDQFLEIFTQLPDWTKRFSFLIDYAFLLAPECPQSLQPFRIESCQSRTCFRAEIRDSCLHVDGWSNSAIMGGIVVACIKIFDGLPVDELARTPIDFHTRSGLIDNMTPMRTDSFREIIRRIIVLCPPSAKPQLCP